MLVAALVLGAGRGDRLRATLAKEAAKGGGRADPLPPKAFVPLAGRPILAHAVEALARCPEIDRVRAVLPADDLARWLELAPGLSEAARAKCGAPVAGGAERQDSVRCGLEALEREVDLVAVHDAARPLASESLVADVVRAARDHGAAFPAIPVADTIHEVEGDRLVATPPRARCRAAQTPQVFRVDWLREALDKARADGVSGTDDAALVARLGNPVVAVPGSEDNRKITTAEDLLWAEERVR